MGKKITMEILWWRAHLEWYIWIFWGWNRSFQARLECGLWVVEAVVFVLLFAKMGTETLFPCRPGLVVCSSQTCMSRQQILALCWRAKIKWGSCSAHTFEEACVPHFWIFWLEKKIYRLSIWIQLFRRSSVFPWHLHMLQLYKSFPWISFCFWDHLSMSSEASRISWHGFFQLIIYYSAKLSSGTPILLDRFLYSYLEWEENSLPQSTFGSW